MGSTIIFGLALTGGRAAAHSFESFSGRSGPFLWQAETLSCGAVEGEPNRIHAHTRWRRSPANGYVRLTFKRQLKDDVTGAWRTVVRKTRTTKNTQLEGAPSILHWSQFFNASANEGGTTSRDVVVFAWRRDRASADRMVFARTLRLSSCVVAPPAPGTPPMPSDGALTGAHWGVASDLPTFRHIGYGFDVTTLNPSDPSSWAGILDAAQANGLKLIIGAYPEPYTYRNGQWSISAAGVNLLNYLASRSSVVLALFVYNEPYWLSPTTGASSSCGQMSAADLRGLRTKIQSVWPGAKIYHDLGEPSAWAPGGYLYKAYSCIGNKYADQSGVADYVGVWDYPFEADGYHKERALSTLTRETNYVINSMHAVPVWLNQSHAASCCDLVFPTKAQLLDWNCSVRKALPVGSLISWYVWRQGIYSDTLSNHPDDWASTTLAACP
jgi:hypothetical protein